MQCAAVSLIHLALESDYFPASIAIYAVDPLESRRSQFLQMAEMIARERWEVIIAGKGRLAEEKLAKEDGINIHIRSRSLEEVRLVHFPRYLCSYEFSPPVSADKGRSNACCFRGEVPSQALEMVLYYIPSRQ